MKKLAMFLSLLVCFCLLGAGTAEATREPGPFRVAQFPLQVQSRMVPSQAVYDRLEKLVDRSMHIPLNGTLKAVHYIPERECQTAWEGVRAGVGHKERLKNLMQPLAEKLHADLVVMPILSGYEQYEIMSWHRWGRRITHSYACVQIVGYDRLKDEAFSKTVSRRFDDEYSSQGDVNRLAYEAMDAALREAQIHDRIWERKRQRVG
ncbi:hypothetical protein SELR_00460 [Selenomonas ruminantium subsp. lactilytica TAM6421]|uniref:Uncharacterized protein n=1 Tax=Selenomonas ruminantium subsp. lactilytica (strain NBRC 103574 / TAM6421) TaxID=927704 RepID=I0GLW7_SELRL|nr:hypothetical protein [Selenomonas ruminantium]BAL81754.1 hypothetical protein SELR_00460 [Selenomonas ruminantium subsp. lactilytica TAM6421]